MATWTAPVSWADGTVIRATFVDEQLSSNMAVVSTHTHGGASGQGGSAIGPLVYADYAGAAAPAPPTDSTVLRYYATATSFAFITSASATFLLSDATHEHAVANVTYTPVQGSSGNLAGQGKTIISVLGTVSTGTLSTAVSIGGTGSRAVYIAGGAFFENTNPGTSLIRVELQDDGVIIATVEATSNDSAGTRSGKGAFHSTLLLNVAAGSVTYSIAARLTTLTGTNTPRSMSGNWLDIREIKQA